MELVPELSPPRVALPVLTSPTKGFGELEPVTFTVSDTSPSGVQWDSSSVPLGSVASSWVTMVHASGGLKELALAWVGGPPGGGWPVFRRVETETWTASPAVDLGSEGGLVTGFAAGKGLAASGTAYGGEGYGVGWQQPVAGGGLETVVSVLDPTGLPVLGPLTVFQGYRLPTLVWSGSTYLLVANMPGGIQIESVRLPSGGAGDVGAVEQGILLPVPQDMNSGRPNIGLLGADVIVAWGETPKPGSTQPARMRVARVSSDGNLLLDSGPSLPAVAPRFIPTLRLDGDRVVVTWSDPGDTTLADNVPGRDKMNVVQLAADLTPLGIQAQIPVTKVSHPPTTLPRGTTGKLLTVWSGLSVSSGLEVVYGARSDCAPGSGGPGVDGTPCATQTLCGNTATSKVWMGGQCVDNVPHWKNGVPSCGAANALCNTNAVCNVSGAICHSTWDGVTCCQ